MRRLMSLSFLLIIPILLGGFGALQVAGAVNCLTLTPESSQSDKDYCKKELASIEAELAELIKKQDAQRQQSGTLQGDINYLQSQINALKAKIKARELAIAQLKVSIKEKNSKITSLSGKIAKQQESLAQLIRNTHDFDNRNLAHLLLTDQSLSNFYTDLENYATMQEAIKESVDEIRGIKTQTEAEKTELQKKQDAEADARAELEGAKNKVALTEAEKKNLLTISKGQEAVYGQLAAQKREVANKIRAALFPLRDAGAIPFGTALSYAEEAQRKTGVRAAFVLAILQQESNLGANVGSCVITNLSTGETKGVNSGTIFPNGIHPTRDLPLLQTIVKGLGRDPLTTRVSCPIGGGYGGAMGPSQFIPSTWNIYSTKIANAVGASMANPWDPRHAIMASSIYLGELGASVGGFTAERTAALKYYAGGNWSKPANSFYGDQVMARVVKIQADIDLLNNQ